MERTQPELDPGKKPAAVWKKASALKKWLFGIAGAASFGVLVLLIFVGKEDKPVAVAKERKVRPRHTDRLLKDTLNSHEWVDLGLPSGTLWATCNVGAASPDEFGEYYAWGETEPKDEYIDINSLTHRKNAKWLREQGIIDADGILTPDHDIATIIWGEPWRMPTDEEFEELLDHCDWQFTDYNGTNGYLITGPNNETIFLVAAGFKQGPTAEYIGDYGDYWSATVVPELIGASCSLGYSSKSYGRRRYARFAGRSVRPVTD